MPYAQARKPETMQEARGWPRGRLGRVGFGTLLCTVGSKRRREGKECFAERTQGARRAGLRNDGSGLAGSQGILFLLAWQLFAAQKACQSPHPRRAAIPGFLIDVPPGWPFWRLSAVSACSAVIIADSWAPSAAGGPTRTGTEAHGHTRGRGEGLLGGRGEGAAARTNPTGSSARLWVYCFPLTKSPKGPSSSYLFRQVVYMMPTAPGVWARASSQPRGFSRVSPS